MAWARIDDNFFNHPKVRKAGKDAVIFHMAALCHSNAFTTDGFIAEDMLELIAAQAFQRKANGLAKVLVECGLWDSIEGGYMIHDYLDYNYSKQQVEEIKSKRAAAGKQGGKQTQSKVSSKIQANDEQNGKQTSSHTHTHINTHTNIDKNPTNQSSSITEKEDDDDLYNAFEAIAVCTPQAKKNIDAAVLVYGASWVKDAIADGITHEAKSWPYVSKILASWKANGKPSNGHKQPGADIEHFRKLYREQKRGAE